VTLSPPQIRFRPVSRVSNVPGIQAVLPFFYLDKIVIFGIVYRTARLLPVPVLVYLRVRSMGEDAGLPP
jgi:hypothetical protein